MVDSKIKTFYTNCIISDVIADWGAIKMRKELALQNATFVYSKGELAYAPLLEEMKSAKEVTIITYNISERQHNLLDCLKVTPNDCVISIITNIPNRWEEYYNSPRGDEFRTRARQKIQIYMTKLAPEEFGKKASIYFNFHNHGKIIMTDTSIYIGSANFSEESAKNIEFGVISKDENFISLVRSELIPDIKAQSIPYYEYDFTELLLEVNMLMAAFWDSYNKLADEIYISVDDHRGFRRYYNEEYDTLSKVTLSNLERICDDCTITAREIVDALCEICGEDSPEYDIAYKQLEQLETTFSKIESLISEETIDELANFNLENYTLSLLESDYAMEAYDENLDHYVNLASDRASSELHDLCEAAHQDLDLLLEEGDIFYSLYGEIISLLSDQEIKKISPKIDNT